MNKVKFVTKKDFFQIDECNCGKTPFRYHDITKNVFVSKCTTTKEEYDIKTKKWIKNKKQPCDFHCMYCEERPVFKEVINVIKIKAKSKFIDKDAALEEQLKLLFKFVFVSNHTATLDEINILVKNSLKREPRKPYYYPSPGHMRISHYESIEDYRDRIFSIKIVDLSYTVERVIKPVNLKCSSNFIVVSDDENDTPENISDNEDANSEDDIVRELSDYDEIEASIVEDEVDETFEEEEEYESGGDYEDYD